jgi:hypothetical protein
MIGFGHFLQIRTKNFRSWSRLLGIGFLVSTLLGCGGVNRRLQSSVATEFGNLISNEIIKSYSSAILMTGIMVDISSYELCDVGQDSTRRRQFLNGRLKVSCDSLRFVLKLGSDTIIITVDTSWFYVNKIDDSTAFPSASIPADSSKLHLSTKSSKSDAGELGKSNPLESESSCRWDSLVVQLCPDIDDNRSGKILRGEAHGIRYHSRAPIFDDSIITTNVDGRLRVVVTEQDSSNVAAGLVSQSWYRIFGRFANGHFERDSIIVNGNK